MKSRGLKIVNKILFVLHLFIGIGALFGGLATITNPKEPLGMSAIYLKDSPFNDFLIPGIILFVVIGLGNLFAALCLGLKIKFKEYISGILGAALIIWIVAQCIILKDVVFLQVLFFIFGAIQGILATILLFEARLFPTKIILKMLKTIK